MGAIDNGPRLCRVADYTQLSGDRGWRRPGDELLIRDAEHGEILRQGCQLSQDPPHLRRSKGRFLRHCCDRLSLGKLIPGTGDGPGITLRF